MESILRFEGDPGRGVVERLHLYRLSRQRLEELVGDNPVETLIPAVLAAESEP
jgi:hypothetical protein